ncbi:RlmE family RNA methyltransferase [Archaeoglobus profundus]|uniref:Ribosomal RNA large subunit methyltransferase E n=1 Tax=Archaeoglobus profundus (strain DSM 5631 / JCM 9629 / NBRC 100127 / Av18) TaxID=572546 RepID=D2RI97_ARCPA|nr:SAM-dependent methyltransferase [Archaeoglobus profundus]ADB58022.1 ribosomal RNA methyltransferase RrmJ/FtsJ [Archaeoglobus profundus DSM 5631]
MRDRRDYYYWQAKKLGYRSRASFKLIQMNRTFKLIKEGDWVLDLGASPGGWSQVAVELGAKVVAVDINPMEPIEGVHFIRGDITREETLEEIKSVRRYYDVVLSDASPKISGKWTIDHLLSIDLARSAFKIAREVLKDGGNFVVKVFQGEEIQNLFNEFKRFFRFKKFHSPKASRKQSAEIYFVGKGFKRFKAQRNIQQSRV